MSKAEVNVEEEGSSQAWDKSPMARLGDIFDGKPQISSGVDESPPEDKKKISEERRASKAEAGQQKRVKEAKNHLQQFFRLINDLNHTQAIAILDELQFQTEQTKLALELPIPPLPEPDKTGNTYPLYVPRTDPLEHLEKHWGTWLKRFNSELDRDYLHQDELGHRDIRLLNAVRARLKYLVKTGEGTETAKDYISPRRARNDAEIEALPQYYRENLGRLMGAAYSRSRMP